MIGYDHRFGKDRLGGLDDLLQRLGPVYGFEVIEIPEQDINDVAISSTRDKDRTFKREKSNWPILFWATLFL